MRRRQLNLKLFGTTKPARTYTKNANRQFAATNRKRNAEGKFMDSVHRSRFERRFARHAIFQITKVPPKNNETRDLDKIISAATFDVDLTLNEVWGVSTPSFRDISDDYDCASLSVPEQFSRHPFITRKDSRGLDDYDYEPLTLRNHTSTN